MIFAGAGIAHPLKSAEALSASPYCKGRWLEEPEGIRKQRDFSNVRCAGNKILRWNLQR